MYVVYTLRTLASGHMSSGRWNTGFVYLVALKSYPGNLALSSILWLRCKNSKKGSFW